MIFRALLAIVALGAPGANASAASVPVRAVLARHDCFGRLAHTTIRKLGVLRVGDDTYKIYNLSFVNPGSHHGMQRVAIFDARNRFIGSYLAEDPAISVKGNRVLFDGPNVYDKGVIVFAKDGPPRQAFIQGYVRDLEDTI